MPTKEITVNIRVEADTPVRLKDKLALLQSFSELPAEDQARMTKLMSNPKALALFAEHEQFLESMISQ